MMPFGERGLKWGAATSLLHGSVNVPNVGTSGTSGTSLLSSNTTTPSFAYRPPSSTAPLPERLGLAPAPSQTSDHRFPAPPPLALEKERPVAVHPTLA